MALALAAVRCSKRSSRKTWNPRRGPRPVETCRDVARRVETCRDEIHRVPHSDTFFFVAFSFAFSIFVALHFHISILCQSHSDCNSYSIDSLISAPLIACCSTSDGFSFLASIVSLSVSSLDRSPPVASGRLRSLPILTWLS